jgi:hypothetical protein
MFTLAVQTQSAVSKNFKIAQDINNKIFFRKKSMCFAYLKAAALTKPDADISPPKRNLDLIIRYVMKF